MIHSFISATKSDSVFLGMLEIVSNKSKICPFHPLYKQRWHTIFQLSWCIFSQINKQSFFFPFLHIAYYNRQLLFPLKCCLSNSLEKLLTNNTPNKNNKQRTKKTPYAAYHGEKLVYIHGQERNNNEIVFRHAEQTEIVFD